MSAGDDAMTLHIYTAPMQPATFWMDICVEPFLLFQWPGNRLLWCRCCDKRRPAKNCVVQNYYDGIYVWCAPGKGCKDPKVIAAKKRREFQHRSLGQKRRWEQVKVIT